MSRALQFSLFVFLSAVAFWNLPAWSAYRSITHNADRFLPAGENGLEKIVIGAVACRSADNITNIYGEQTWTMLKSILLSAHLYNISRIEFHLFLEYLEDVKYFRDRIEESGHPFSDMVTIKTYSAVEIVPEKFRQYMIYHPRWRCDYTRFFFPEALPEVDALIYFDSDMVYTGNIRSVWEFFGQMDTQQLVGVVRQREPENNKFPELEKASFGRSPHVEPRGINDGLMLMNLSRMREFSFSEKMSRIGDDYNKMVKKFCGQMALNVLLYFNPRIMKLLPCHFNFGRTHCLRGLFCDDVKEDQYGIQLVHGTALTFVEGKVFHPIYKGYQQFELTGNITEVVEKLMKPIRSSFANKSTDGTTDGCSGTLNHLLFRNYF